MKMTRKKVIILTAIILLIGFIAWNVSWYVYVSKKYTPLTEVVPKDKYGSHHIVDSDGYNFSVTKPMYLFFTGNLAVVAPDIAYTLIIWPEVFGGYEYGLRIQDANSGYEIMVDEDGNALRLEGQSDREFEQAVAAIQDHKENIQIIFEKAHSLWDLE